MGYRSPIGREDAPPEPAPNEVQPAGLTQIENRLG
jgi:hypothetical protein